MIKQHPSYDRLICLFTPLCLREFSFQFISSRKDLSFSDFIDRELKKRKDLIEKREKKEEGEAERIIYDVGQNTDDHSDKVQTKNGQTCEKLAA